QAPSFQAAEHAHIRKRLRDGSRGNRSDQLNVLIVVRWKPLLQDAVVTQSRFDRIVKLIAVQQARSRGFDWWRRIGRDDVELLRGSLEKPPAVVDTHVGLRAVQKI